MRPAIRISLGIVALSTCLLLTADALFEIFPDPHSPELEARKDLSESLAVQYSSLVTANRLESMRPAMEAVVRQIPRVLSMRLRNAEGRVLAVTSEHQNLWEELDNDMSTPTQVLIPIFKRDKQWGALEVKFARLGSGGLFGFLNHPLYKLLALMAAGGFLSYLLYLSRTLRYLDPSSVVPSRVRAALDQLVEGVFILDHNQRIVLVNTAFAKKVDLSPDALLGADPSALPWVKEPDLEQPQELPWTKVIRDGTRLTEQRLELESPTNGTRVLTANVSPIVDGSGNSRGVLASFDDISEVERMNKSLLGALSDLEAANVEVRNKNDELFRLATLDPLTGCLNRRAFFERFETEFDLSVKNAKSLSVMMGDIDHFKSINDNFGHAVGDDVIKEIADVLRTSSGENDCVGRYGGEEFCVVLVATDIDAAKDVGERARLEFERRMCRPDSATNGRPVTASFGVSTISFGAQNVADFLDQADQALYHSKNNGRNRVTVWSDSRTEKQEASKDVSASVE